METSSLVKWQLQILGIFHLAPIHRRDKCIMCTDPIDKCSSSMDTPTESTHEQSSILEEYGLHIDGEASLRGRSHAAATANMGGDDLLLMFPDGGFYDDTITTNNNNFPGDVKLTTKTEEQRSGLDGVGSRGGGSGVGGGNGVGGGGGHGETQCMVCESLHWDGDGQRIHDIEDLVPRPTWRAIGTTMSLLFMVVITFGMGYNSFLYLRYLFGREDEVMHLTSFMTFSIGLSSVGLICIYAKLRYYLSGNGGNLDGGNGVMPIHWGWCGVLHQDYMARRLQYLYGVNGLSLPSRAFLASCIFWPLVNVGLEVFYVIVLRRGTCKAGPHTADCESINQLFAYTEVATVTLGMLLFGVFCHTLFLVRHSFEIECNLLVYFIDRNEGRLDHCRMRLADTYRDYRLFRSAIRPWMVFVIAIGILGMTVHISWNYDVYSGSEKLTGSTVNIVALNILIFSEKLMLLVLPLIALSSLDMSYLWRQFHYALSRRRRGGCELFWDRLVFYLRDLHECDRTTGITMFISVISMYMGLKLSTQNLDYASFPFNH